MLLKGLLNPLFPLMFPVTGTCLPVFGKKEGEVCYRDTDCETGKGQHEEGDEEGGSRGRREKGVGKEATGADPGDGSKFPS